MGFKIDLLRVDYSVYYRPGVYYLYNNQNCKMYIGGAVNMYNRIHGHFHHLRQGTHHNTFLQSDFNRYGIEAFDIGIHERCLKEKLSVREQSFIDKYLPEYNRNLSTTEPFHRTYTEEQRKWQSEDRKRKFATGQIKAYQAKEVTLFRIDGTRIGCFDTIEAAKKHVGINHNHLNIDKPSSGYVLKSGNVPYYINYK